MLSPAVYHLRTARILIALSCLFLLSPITARAQSIQSPTIVHAFSNQITPGSNPVGRLIQAPDGFLYGTCSSGGAYGNGTVFREDPATDTLTTVYSFTGSGTGGTGSSPLCGLILAADGNLYGTTNSRGQYGYGTAFSVNLSANPVTVTKIHDFNDAADNGGAPVYDSVIQGSDENLYGTTYQGGAFGAGTVWKMALNGSGFTILHNFRTASASDGTYPAVGVMEGNDGKLYGTTNEGGTNNRGTVYLVNKDGTGFGLAHSFNDTETDGREPQSALIKRADGKLYGAADRGGLYDLGILYCIDPSAGNAFSIVYNFDGATGAYPLSGLSTDGGGNLYGTTLAGGATGYGTAFVVDTSLNYTVITNFSGADAYQPYSPPILASDGNLYGTSNVGGLGVQYTDGSADGSLYSVAIDPSSGQGSSSLLHSFGVYEDGYQSPNSPVLGADGSVYGVDYYGGALNQGILYQVAPSGGYRILHTFSQYGQEGQNPTSAIQGPDGSFYGTCQYGGRYNRGTVWMMDSSGNLTVLHHFRGADGDQPLGRLLFGQDGNLYGTTLYGGATGEGTVFTVGTDGTGFRDLHDFSPNFGNDGYYPSAGLVQDAAGVLYGVTGYGGANARGAFFKLNTDGTGYSVLHSLTLAEGANPQGTPVLAGPSIYAVCPSGASGNGSLLAVDSSSGTTSMIHAFTDTTGGANPQCDLFLGGDGLLYGTCFNGDRPSGNGTVWKCSTGGAFTLLQTFTAATGTHPIGGVVVDGGGTVYGTTSQDGPNGGGTLFSIP